MRRLWLLAFSLLVFAVVVFTHDTLARADEKNAAILTALDNDWSKAAATKDVDRVASYYAEDAIARSVQQVCSRAPRHGANPSLSASSLLRRW